MQYNYVLIQTKTLVLFSSFLTLNIEVTYVPVFFFFNKNFGSTEEYKNI